MGHLLQGVVEGLLFGIGRCTEDTLGSVEEGHRAPIGKVTSGYLDDVVEVRDEVRTDQVNVGTVIHLRLYPVFGLRANLRATLVGGQPRRRVRGLRHIPM